MSNSAVPSHAIPFRAASEWARGAFSLWMRAPIRLLLIALAPLLFEALLQAIPWVGLILSKILVPIATFGVLRGCAELAEGRQLRIASMLDGFRRSQFARCFVLASLSVSIFASQLFVAVLVYGPCVFDAVVLGHFLAYPQLHTRAFALTLILPGAVLGTLLVLVVPLVLLSNVAPVRAIWLSVRCVVGNPIPFLQILMICTAVLAMTLGSAWGILLLPPFMAWSAALPIVVWKSIVANVYIDISSAARA